MIRPVKILAFLEANSITGPAKNLLDFGTCIPELQHPLGPGHLSIATFRRPHNPPSDPFSEAAKDRSIPLHIIQEDSPFDLKSIRAIRQLVSTLKPDLIQTHNVKSHFLFCLSGLSRYYPWIAWHHGYTQPTFKQVVYNRFNFLSLRWASHVVSVTGAFRDELHADGVSPDNISVIRNAIQPNWISDPLLPPPQLPRKSICPDSSRILLSVGRLSKEKAHANLIEAIALLKKNQPSLPPIHLLLVGDGPEKTHLTQLAARLQVPLTLTGQVNSTRPFFALADLFVLPSLSEGSPNALIEAMACALPIVATSAGGIPETASHQSEALLVKPACTSSLADAIAKLLSDPLHAKSLGLAAQSRVSQELLPIPRSESILSLYRKILSKP